MVSAKVDDVVVRSIRILHSESSAGEWGEGASSHDMVAKNKGMKPYHVASFRHSRDASLVDVCHKHIIDILDELEALRKQVKTEIVDGHQKGSELVGDILVAENALSIRLLFWEQCPDRDNTINLSFFLGYVSCMCNKAIELKLYENQRSYVELISLWCKDISINLLAPKKTKPKKVKL